MISEPSTSLFLQGHEREFAAEKFSTATFSIKPCDVGLGVFARRPIAAGEPILTFGGPLIDFAETKRRGRWECMPLQVGPNEYFDTQPPGIFVNHSCEPNAGIRQDRELMALRDIAPGEEIRFDYSTTMEEQSFTMSCLCGSRRCRGRVGDFSTLPEPVQAEYVAQGIVMSFIVQKLGRLDCRPNR